MRTGYVQQSITNQIDHAFENFLGSIARHRTVVGETLSTDSTHMTFEAWAARGETQAKLDAVFAMQKPDQAMPAIKLTSQTVEGYVLGAVIDHRALVVQVDIPTAEGLQEIPKVEILTLRDREKLSRHSTKYVLDREIWEEQKVVWAANLNETIQHNRRVGEEIDILQLLNVAVVSTTLPKTERTENLTISVY
eukprot:129183-Rhodomonas_salina.1